MCGLCQLACNAKRSIIFEYSSWIVRDFVRTKYMHDTFLILSHEKNRVSNFCLYEIQYMTTIVIMQKQDNLSVDMVMSSVRLRKTYFVHIATCTHVVS